MSEECDRFVKQVDAYIMSLIDENSPVVSNVLIENAGEDPKLRKKVEVSQVPSKMKNEEIENFLVTKKAPMNSFIKKGGELLTFEGGDGNAFGGNSNTGGGLSLQENFKRFRKQKVKERRIMLQNKEELKTKGPRSQEFKDALREKFINQAKKYIGVPYAERYKKPDDPIAPLYLDCCGLVRKVVQDLAEDFGFLIGRWNQAYMFDTLPVDLTLEEMKPGDLIFYEANFTNPDRCKAQKHNMTHVEIFLGGETGRATLGSRYFRGKVSIYPEYEFPCTTWTCYKHHFRSLDTWLDGICKSFCDEHAWIIDSGLMLDAAAGKRSIFSYDSDDEHAGGYDDFEDEVHQQTAEEKSSCGCDHSRVQIDSDKTAVETPMTDGLGDAGGSTESLPVPIQASEEPDLSRVRVSPVPITHNLTSASTSRLPPHVQAVGESGKTPPRGAKGSRTGSKQSEVSASMSAVPAPYTYYVGKANGWKLIKAAMDKRGWQQLPFEYEFSSRFGMKWVERRSQIDYRSHTPGQLVCHIPNNEVITTKIGLLTTLRDKFSKQKKLDSNVRLPTPWVPETYQLDVPTDVQALLDANKELSEKTDDKGKKITPIWIYKPSCMNRGTGIKVLAGEKDLRLVAMGQPANKRQGIEAIPPLKGIVQRYLDNQLLVKNAMNALPAAGESVGEDQGGFKFDYRCYLLIARNQPSVIALFHPGYARFTTTPYSADLDKLDDPSIHLTNASVQKKQAAYKDDTDVKDRQTQSLEMICQRLEADGKHDNAAYLRERFLIDVKRCMVDVLKASHAKFIRKAGYFDLLGLDFMVTDDNQCMLIEANTNPALATTNDVMKECIPDAVDGTIELVLGLQGPQRKELVPKPAPIEAESPQGKSVSMPTRRSRETVTYDHNLICENDKPVLSSIPGRWELLFNEETKEYWAPDPIAKEIV